MIFVEDGLKVSGSRIACGVDGIAEIEKYRIRKSGLGYLTDLHLVVDGKISVHKDT